MPSKNIKINWFASKIGISQFLTPTFYVRNFSDPDLPILDQLVKDTVLSQVSGETAERSILKQHH